MSKFRYDTSGQWFKGNTHIHSVASDGGKTVDEITEMYSSRKYDFLFLTDHWVASDVKSTREGSKSPLLLLDGMELDGATPDGGIYHVVCLGRCDKSDRADGFDAALEAARRKGCVLILAHPLWSGNTTEEALAKNFHGVEIYNHVCSWLNGKSDGLAHWSAMLEKNPDTLGLSADDAHIRAEHPGWDGGWIMVNAGSLDEQDILSAIKKGNYYSSTGPRIKSLKLNGDTLEVTTSPVQFMRLVGPAWRGIQRGSFDGAKLTKAEFKIPADWPYAYLDIEDSRRRRAWTNTLFTNAQ